MSKETMHNCDVASLFQKNMLSVSAMFLCSSFLFEYSKVNIKTWARNFNISPNKTGYRNITNKNKMDGEIENCSLCFGDFRHYFGQSHQYSMIEKVIPIL